MTSLPESPEENPPPMPEKAQEKTNHRTVGNKVFDWFIYPIFAFATVFTFSTWATWKGRYGTGFIREGYEKLARVIEKSPLMRNVPDSPTKFESAKGHAMVLVSFLAGTLIIAPIKWFEDERQKISRFFDNVLGTTPDDPSLYAKEPKQGWRSVLGGRALTFATVLGIDKIIGGHIIHWSGKTADKLTGKAVNLMQKQDIAAGKGWQVAFVASFETFYTALCATLVYFISRSLARIFNKNEAKEESLAESVKEAVVHTHEQNKMKSAEETKPRKEPPPWSRRVENDRVNISPSAVM